METTRFTWSMLLVAAAIILLTAQAAYLDEGEIEKIFLEEMTFPVPENVIVHPVIEGETFAFRCVANISAQSLPSSEQFKVYMRAETDAPGYCGLNNCSSGAGGQPCQLFADKYDIGCWQEDENPKDQKGCWAEEHRWQRICAYRVRNISLHHNNFLILCFMFDPQIGQSGQVKRDKKFSKWIKLQVLRMSFDNHKHTL